MHSILDSTKQIFIYALWDRNELWRFWDQKVKDQGQVQGHGRIKHPMFTDKQCVWGFVWITGQKMAVIDCVQDPAYVQNKAKNDFF